MLAKHIFVTGGVSSSLGKGLTASSLGRLLKSRGLRVTMQKLDPYINVDPGTMNPFEHGEVFVTDDGGETDLDLGHYERFIDEALSRDSNATTGSIYQSVIAKERRGRVPGQDRAGDPPHHQRDQAAHPPPRHRGRGRRDHRDRRAPWATSRSSRSSRRSASSARTSAGTTSATSTSPWCPTSGPSGEQKTKPTQHSVTELRSRGVQPDVIILRSDRPIPDGLKTKISLLCDVPEEAVISNVDAPNLYEIPLALHEEGLDDYVCRILRLGDEPGDAITGAGNGVSSTSPTGRGWCGGSSAPPSRCGSASSAST